MTGAMTAGLVQAVNVALVGGVAYLGVCGVAAWQGVEATAICGPSVSTPFAVKLQDAAGKAGDAGRAANEQTWTSADTNRFVQGGWGMATMTATTFSDHFNGRTENAYTTQWRTAAATSQQAARDACCVTVSTVSGGTGSLAPANRSKASGGETAVWKALRAEGVSEVHAAGIMGNMQPESGFDATIVQGGGHSNNPRSAGGRGYGLVQWTPGSKLSDYIGNEKPTVGNEVATVLAQLRGEGPHPETAAGKAFFKTTTVEDAAQVFHLRYERSASKDSSERIRNAKRIFSQRGGAVVAASQGADVPPEETPEPKRELPIVPGKEIPGGPEMNLGNPPVVPEQCSPATEDSEEPDSGGAGGSFTPVAGKPGRVMMDGKAISAIAAAQIVIAEKESGLDMRVMQGGYGGAHYGPSGTSHNFPGVADIACSSTQDCIAKETATRKAGFASWARNIPGRSSVGSGKHVHASSLLDPGNKEAPQIKFSWPGNGNGLSGRNNDPAPHPAWYPNLVLRVTGGKA